MSAQFDGFNQIAAAANRANRLALETAESAFGVQLKTFEKNINAAAGFFGAMAQTQDLGNLRELLPQGLQIAKDNLERLAAANQEVVGMSLKTSEALGELVRQPFADTPKPDKRRKAS